MRCDYAIHDRCFADYLLGNCQVEKLYTGCRWAEGPVYSCDRDFLVWSDIPNQRMLCDRGSVLDLAPACGCPRYKVKN